MFCNYKRNDVFLVEKYKSISSTVVNGQQKTNSPNQNGNPLETIDCK